jgi:hypothetical protein
VTDSNRFSVGNVNRGRTDISEDPLPYFNPNNGAGFVNRHGDGTAGT